MQNVGLLVATEHLLGQWKNCLSLGAAGAPKHKVKALAGRGRQAWGSGIWDNSMHFLFHLSYEPSPNCLLIDTGGKQQVLLVVTVSPGEVRASLMAASQFESMKTIGQSPSCGFTHARAEEGTGGWLRDRAPLHPHTGPLDTDTDKVLPWLFEVSSV